jgi:hypothetical protein
MKTSRVQVLRDIAFLPAASTPPSRQSVDPASGAQRIFSPFYFFLEQVLQVYGTDQCAPSNASKLAIADSNDPPIAIVASTPRGKSTLVIEARKIAAIGRAMTK